MRSRLIAANHREMEKISHLSPKTLFCGLCHKPTVPTGFGPWKRSRCCGAYVLTQEEAVRAICKESQEIRSLY